MKPITLALAAASGLILCACSDSGILPRTSGPSLSPADFVDSSAVLVPASAPALRPPTPADTIGPIAASGGIFDVTATPGKPGDQSSSSAANIPPAISAAAPAPVGSATFVDAKVGDINGKPVYATAFFDPFADRLRAEAAQMSHLEWLRSTHKQIEDKINEMVRNELLRAEALENFSPEQKAGFFTWMKSVQEKIESRNKGSREATDEYLQATEGKSLDQFMKEEEQKQLVEFQLTQKIDKRVSVPWRDIRQEYDRYFDVFNPNPVAKYHLIQIPKSKPDVLAEFTRQRDSGTPMIQIASDKKINAYKADTAGLEKREIKTARESAELFGDPLLNKAAQTMNIGDTVGPMVVGDNNDFLFLEGIDHPSRSLYDAQVSLEMALRNQRKGRATDAYINHLRERASISSTTDMTSQLLRIADSRFWPPGKK